MSKSNDTQLQEIMKGINNGTTQLPDFQRGWIWDDERIRRLIASITCNYPIGAVLFLEYGGDGLRFKSRAFTNVEEIGKTPEVLVLDGQQRLTSVYCAMCNANPVPTTLPYRKDDTKRFYYLDIAKCLDPNADRVDAVISVSALKTKQSRGHTICLDLSAKEKEFKEHMFPLNIVFNSIATDTWRDEYRDYHNRRKDLEDRLRVFSANVLNPITTYTLPVIQLERSLPKDAVCQVFENVNTGGMQLTMFDLVTATFAADDYFLREDWENRQRNMNNAPGTFSLLSAVSPTDFLVSMTLLSQYKQGKTLASKRKDVLSLSLANYKNNVEDLMNGYIKSAQFLVQQGIYAARDLPYTTQLIPLSILMTLLGKKSEDESVKSKLSVWFWCGVFGEMYGMANETRFSNDILIGLPWINKKDEPGALFRSNDGSEPSTVSQAFFHPERIYALKSRSGAAYKGVMALLIKEGARDFITGEKIDGTKGKTDNVDIHFIFPQSYCEKEKIDKRSWSCVANKTPLKAATNKAIKGFAPSEYLKNIENKNRVPYKLLCRNLASHAIDVSALRMNDFNLFFEKRCNDILELIGRAMDKKIGSMSDHYEDEYLQEEYEDY